MFLTSRFRAARARNDRGAVAVVVAIVSLLLFSTAALAVDLGVMYNRRRAAQLDADLAALAGSVMLPGNTTGARALAYDYLERNLPPGGDIGPLLNYSDGNLNNGEIYFPTATKIRVVVPPREVQFGFANAMGFSNGRVSAAATVEVRSPAAALPFFLTVGASSGYSCLKDDTGGNNSPVRSALLMPAKAPTITGSPTPSTASTLGGTTITITGSDLKGLVDVRVDGQALLTWTEAPSGKSMSFVAPAHAAGPATVSLENADGSASATFTYVAPGPTPAPLVTALSPSSGPTIGGDEVTITGQNLTGATAVLFGTVPATTFTVVNATTIEATSPPGTGAVNVTVTTPGGTSGATTANLYTYEVDECAGENGSYGYLDIPRSKAPTPNGENDRIMVNIAAGIDHGWQTFPGFSDTDPSNDLAVNTECTSGNTTISGAVLDDGDGVEGANCIDTASGNKIGDIGTAFLDGWSKLGFDLDPKLEAPSSHDSITLHGRNGMDGDHIEDFLTVPLTTFVNNLATNPNPSESSVNGWLKAEIATCPRFAIVPVLNVDDPPQNGFYPIKGFAGVFIDGSSPDHGFDPNNNGNQIQSIRAYAFSLNYLPGVLSAGTTEGTVTFIGTGPKVPVLVHDEADPAY